jgi:tetratricopeptide (TPR) repeat protein
MGRSEAAKRILDRVLKEAPVRAIGRVGVHGVAFTHVALAQLHLATGNPDRALCAATALLGVANKYRLPLEEGAAHRLLGQVHQATGDRAEADAAFRRSLEILGNIQCRPELAQTLLAYGISRRGDNSQEDRVMIARALSLFEEMNATGWIEEARAALAAA